MSFALFWDITQRRVLIFTDVSAQDISSIFKGQEVRDILLLDSLTIQDGTDTLFRNVGKVLPLDAA
jgi:hypothetical protein